MEDIADYKHIEQDITMNEGDFVVFQEAGRTHYCFKVINNELQVICRHLKSDYETIEEEHVWEGFFEE